MSPDQQVTPGAVLLAEYGSVKDEQRARIGFRDNLLYATLASMAAVIAGTVPAHHSVKVLLLLPPVSILLGWTYLVNDEKISAIGRYVRDELTPRITALMGHQDTDICVFGWESAHRGDARRISRKYLQLVVDLLIFCGAPLAAVVVFWTGGAVAVPLFIVSLVELAAVCVLAWQITVYADLAGSPGALPGPRASTLDLVRFPENSGIADNRHEIRP